MNNASDITSGRVFREILEKREEELLAPYAMKSADSAGRRHPEPEDAFRTAYRRDHDRIVHSAAFRRLQHKTQVFASHEGDYYRTRLTHSLEVAQIAVSIARVLRLNEDLVQTVSLAHDIGHPPFGHAGQDVLRELMAGHGGFEHNSQGLRIVDLLESRYADFTGLNLTGEVRESINKHRLGAGARSAMPAPLLETRLADRADELAYLAHDVDDGLTAGILSDAILSQSEFWREIKEDVVARCGGCDPEIAKYQMVREIVNRQVRDLVEESARMLGERGIDSVKAVRGCADPLIDFSEGMRRRRASLQAVLWRDLYRHERVLRIAQRAQQVIRALFLHYVEQPEDLPASTRRRVEQEGVHRAVCDYVAGMTDRYCLSAYRKRFDPGMEL